MVEMEGRCLIGRKQRDRSDCGWILDVACGVLATMLRVCGGEGGMRWCMGGMAWNGCVL